MFRIGFDPMLEAGQRNAEIIQAMHKIRLADEAMNGGRLYIRNGNKLLAQLGRRLASIGSSLIERYDEQMESPLGLNQRSTSGNCS